MSTEALAMHGGTPVRTKPFPGRDPFGLCPNAELALKQVQTLPLNERTTAEDVADIVTAVRKVAAALTH